jgi:TonB family protein
MSSFLSFITSYFVNSVWEMALIGGAGWLVSRLLKRLGSHAEHIAWVTTLLLAVVTPALPLFRWLLRFLPMSNAATEHSSITLVAVPGGGLSSASVYVLPTIFAVLLLSLYFGSVVYFATRFARSLYCTRVLLRQAQPLSLTAQQEEIWRHCKQSFSLDTASILSSPGLSGPVAVGLGKPLLLVPEEFAVNCMPIDFLAALAHECAHMKRHDFQKNLLYEVTSLVVAFHPITWMLKSRIAQTREMVCDGMATERLIDSRSYTQALLRLATMVAMTSQVLPSHAIGIFDANILEKRIMMMNLKRKRIGSGLKYGVIAPAILFLLSVAVGGAAMAVVIEPQSASATVNQAQTYGKIYHVGKGVSAPVLVSSKEPEFPESARGKKDTFQGVCLIGLVVDSTGAVHDVHVKRSLRPDFDANAIKAVEQYRFKPATRSGKPVAVALTIEVNFQRF